MATVEQAHRCHRAEDPREERDLGDIRLAEEKRFRRIQPAGQKIERYVARIFAQGFGIVERRQCVQVGDEIERLALVLQFDGRTHHAEVIAEVQRAGRLDAGKDAFHVGQGFNHREHREHRGNEAADGMLRRNRAAGCCRTSGRRQGRRRYSEVLLAGTLALQIVSGVQ